MQHLISLEKLHFVYQLLHVIGRAAGLRKLSFPLADESEYGTAGQPYKSLPEVRGDRSAARALSAPLRRYPYQVPVTAAACTAALRGTRDFAERPTDSSLVMLIAEHSTKDPDKLIMWSLSIRSHAGTCPGGVRVMHVQRLNPPFSCCCSARSRTASVPQYRRRKSRAGDSHTAFPLQAGATAPRHPMRAADGERHCLTLPAAFDACSAYRPLACVIQSSAPRKSLGHSRNGTPLLHSVTSKEARPASSLASLVSFLFLPPFHHFYAKYQPDLSLSFCKFER